METVFKANYENGQLAYEWPMNNEGKTDGLHKIYFPNGNLKYESLSVNGNIVGTEKHYYESGNIAKEAFYESGWKNGLEKVFRSKGGIRYTWYNKVGSKNGVFREFDENGKCIKSKYFEMGHEDKSCLGPIKCFISNMVSEDLIFRNMGFYYNLK